MSGYPFQYKRVVFDLDSSGRIKPFNVLLIFDKDIDLSEFDIVTINNKNRGTVKRFLEETLFEVKVPQMNQTQFQRWFIKRPLLSQIEHKLTSKDMVNILNFLDENKIKYELIYNQIMSAHVHTQHPRSDFLKCLPSPRENSCLSFISFENKDDLVATKLKFL